MCQTQGIELIEMKTAHKTAHKGSLRYRQIVCSGCNSSRVVGLPCPVCGARPDDREVDPNRQSRQALARRVRARLNGALPEVAAPDPRPAAYWEQASRHCQELLDSLFAAVADQAEEPRLGTAIDSLLESLACANRAPRLRPWREEWATVESVLENLRGVVSRYLDAIEAEDPRIAQEAARDAQDRLDSAAQPATELSSRMAAWRRVEEAADWDQALAITTELAAGSVGTAGILAFDSSGQEVFEAIVGVDGRCPIGLGVGLQLVARLAEGPFDRERFWRTVKATASLMLAEEGRAKRLVESSDWAGDMREALVRDWDYGHLIGAQAAAARNDRQEIIAAMEAARHNVEGSGKFQASTLLALTKAKGYEVYRTKSSGALLDAADQDPLLSDLLEGVNTATRNAGAHESFQLRGERVVLLDHGKEVEQLDVPVLIDRVLAGAESTMAIGLGLLCGAVVLGADYEQLLPDPAGMIDECERVAMALSASGWTGVTVTRTNADLTATGLAPEGSPTLQEAAACLPFIEEDAASLALVGESASSSQTTLSVPVVALTRWRDCEDEFEKKLVFIELLTSATIDGEAHTDRDQARRLLCRLALQELADGPEATRIRRLRVLRDSARRMRDGELDEVLISAISGYRSILSGLRVPDWGATVGCLSGWASMKTRELRT